jgi:hypothetical protein
LADINVGPPWDNDESGCPEDDGQRTGEPRFIDHPLIMSGVAICRQEMDACPVWNDPELQSKLFKECVTFEQNPFLESRLDRSAKREPRPSFVWLFDVTLHILKRGQAARKSLSNIALRSVALTLICLSIDR